MPKYEYELLEQKKQEERKIARIIILIIPTLMFIFGILIGIGQLNTNPDYISQHLKSENLCEFCIPAMQIPTQNTINIKEQETKPVSVNFKSTTKLPKCLDTTQSYDIQLSIMADKPVYLQKLTLYTPLNFTVNKITDPNTHSAIEFTNNPTPGANTVNISIKDNLQNIQFVVNGKFNNSGDFNILPILVLQNDEKSTLPTIPLHVIQDCQSPTPSLTPTNTPSANPTPQASGETTPTPTEEITISPTEIPNTGIIDTTILLTIGIALGFAILKIRNVDLKYEKLNIIFNKIYNTAYNLLIRSFGAKGYTEQKILEKVITSRHSIQKPKTRKSSP